MKTEPRHRFVFYEDAPEGTKEISVYPENEDNYLQPDVGDKITIPDLDDQEAFEILQVTQVEDTHIYEFSLDRILEEECVQGTNLFIKRS